MAALPETFEVTIKPDLTWAFLATQCAIAVVCGAIGSAVGTAITLALIRC